MILADICSTTQQSNIHRYQRDNQIMPRHQAKTLSHKTRNRKETKNRSQTKYSRRQIEGWGEETARREQEAPSSSRSRTGSRTDSRTRSGTSRTSSSSRSRGSAAAQESTPSSRNRTNSRTSSSTNSATRSRSANSATRSRNADSATSNSSSTRQRSASSRTTAPARNNQEGKSGTSAIKRPARQLRQETPLRLNKFLADAGIASRRAADELIASGMVKVNGKVVKELGIKIHPADLVTVKGEPVSYIKHLTYIVLNKPKDYITTTSDEKGRKTVMDLIPLKQRLYPVGRLDRNTTGALIITNDGDLATRLMHPKYGVEREYVVGLDKKLKGEHAQNIANGVELEDGMTGQTELWINPSDNSEVRIMLKEGKNREVRRIFEHFGYEVKRLHRVRYALITVTGMARGEYRHLTRDEVRALKKLVGLESRE